MTEQYKHNGQIGKFYPGMQDKQYGVFVTEKQSSLGEWPLTISKVKAINLPESCQGMYGWYVHKSDLTSVVCDLGAIYE